MTPSNAALQRTRNFSSSSAPERFAGNSEEGTSGPAGGTAVLRRGYSSLCRQRRSLVSGGQNGVRSPLSRVVDSQGTAKLVHEKCQVCEAVAVQRRTIDLHTRLLTLERRGCDRMEIVGAGGPAERVKLPLQPMGCFTAPVETGGQCRCDRCDAVRHRADKALLEVEQLSFECGRGSHLAPFRWRRASCSPSLLIKSAPGNPKKYKRRGNECLGLYFSGFPEALTSDTSDGKKNDVAAESQGDCCSGRLAKREE